MSGYTELRDLGVTFRPIDTWPGELASHRNWSSFRASWGDTLELLAKELRKLNATQIVVQLAMGEGDFRRDGLPRANAYAEHPGVVIAFESRHGPLKYAVDTYAGWQENVRAIAKSLYSLRMVDRYGVTKRGEQYTGWRAIPQNAGDISTPEQARAFIDEHGGSYREAAKRLHPDHDGDAGAFRQLTQAKAVLDRAGAPA